MLLDLPNGPEHFSTQRRCYCPALIAQGSTTPVSKSSKCRTLRVATVARRASAMPAIRVSRTSTARPPARRRAARRPAASAAARSRDATRPAKSSCNNPSNAVSSPRRFRPSGMQLKPKRTSNALTAVVHTRSGACRSSQATTAASSGSRIKAESTFVSSKITRRSLPDGPLGYLIRAGRRQPYRDR